MRLKRNIFYFIGFAVVGALVYGAAIKYGFLSWDDDYNITANSWVTAGRFDLIWTKTYYGFFIPMTYSVWALIAGFGDQPNPAYFHALNIGLHVLNTCFVYSLIDRFTQRGDLKAPAVGALLFLVHPLQVETVCWATGLRDLLSASFALSALLVHFKSKNRINDFFAFLLFAFAVLSKPAAVMLPLAAFALDFHQDRAKWKKSAVKLIPWLALSILIPLVTLNAQHDLGSEQVIAWYLRPIVALDALGFYLQKLFWPFPLAVDYGRTPVSIFEHVNYPGTLLTFLAVAAALIVSGNIVFLLVPCILLLPVLGLLPFAFQYVSTVADHYMYLPVIGIAMILATVYERIPKPGLKLLIWMVLASLATVSQGRATVWQNNTSFYTDMLQKNPSSFSANIGLGDSEALNGRFEAASQYYKRALEISPINGLAQVGLVKTLFLSNRYNDVIKFAGSVASNEARFTQENRNYYAQLYYFFGLSYLQVENLLEANDYLCKAANLAPENTGVTAALKDSEQKYREHFGADPKKCN